MATPRVKIIVAAALYGGVVALMLLPPEPPLLGSAGLVGLTLLTLGLAAVGWVVNKVRIERTDRAQRRLELAAGWRVLAEIGWLEELHLMPAREPNRSTHTRTSKWS